MRIDYVVFVTFPNNIRRSDGILQRIYNAPTLEKEEIIFKISPSAGVGSKFFLERAMDLDVGNNDLQNYILKPSDNFALKIHNQADGLKNVEMVLQKAKG